MNLAEVGVLIAGGASGLGEATARRLAARGARVTIADIEEHRGSELAAIEGFRFVRCDVRDPEQVARAVDHAVEAAGPQGLRVAVSCAGRGSRSKLASSRGPHPREEFRDIVDLNLIGTFEVMRLAAHAMLANEPDADGERGVIVTTASIAAFEGQSGQLAYSATKAAIAGMTLTASRDMADKGIRVMSIAPGVFDTPLLGKLPEEVRQALGAGVPFPRRLGRSEEFAHLVETIATNAMLNGTVIRLDGALRMAPS
jgi:NAD(P)-dependent dehydrogenase (short-subunit alcohol dehydrogenase family)